MASLGISGPIQSTCKKEGENLSNPLKQALKTGVKGIWIQNYMTTTGVSRNTLPYLITSFQHVQAPIPLRYTGEKESHNGSLAE